MRNNNGFTLIEVLVAMVVVAVVVLSIASAAVTTIKADTAGEQVSGATVLAEAKLEQMRVLKRDSAAWMTESPQTETGLKADGTTGGLYRRVTTVDLNYIGLRNFSQVTVDVYEGSGATPLVTLASLYW